MILLNRPPAPGADSAILKPQGTANRLQTTTAYIATPGGFPFLSTPYQPVKHHSTPSGSTVSQRPLRLTNLSSTDSVDDRLRVGASSSSERSAVLMAPFSEMAIPTRSPSGNPATSLAFRRMSILQPPSLHVRRNPIGRRREPVFDLRWCRA